MSHWVVIPNEELVEGAVSAHEHFRIIRDNTTIIEKREDFDSAPTTTVMTQWRLDSSPEFEEEIGRGGRRYGFFGPREAIIGTVTRYIWQVEYNAIAKFSMTITPPPDRDRAILIGLEAFGDGIDREDDRSIWRLGDFDFSFSNNTLHIYYHTYTLGDRLFRGKERNNGGNLTDSDITDANYPNGSRVVNEDPPDSPPKYRLHFRTIWASGGSLPATQTKAPVGNIPF